MSQRRIRTPIWMVRTAGLFAVVAGLLSAFAAPASAGPTMAHTALSLPTKPAVIKASTYTFRLQNQHSHLCLAVAGASTAAGAQIVQWTCNTSADKYWYVADAGYDGMSHLVNVNSGLCLGVAGGSQAEGANLVQWPCVFGPNDQAWRGPYITGYTFYIENIDGQVVGIAGSSTAAGAKAVQWVAAYPPVDQEWSFS